MFALTDPVERPQITLRPYQLACIERVLAAVRRTPRGGRALIIIPTGGGKTVIFSKVAHELGTPTLVIAHRQELLQQAAEKYRLFDPTAVIGQVGAGRHEWGYQVTVASIQTLSRPEHLKALKRFKYGLVIIDEAHHACAPGYQSVLETLPDTFVLGVTATPDRMDGQRIQDLFGLPLFEASVIDMITQGYLSNLRAIAIPTDTSLDTIHTQDGDYKLDELEVVVDTPDRNLRLVQAYRKHCTGQQGLCFAVTVAHAVHLAEAFTAAGVRAAVISGETPTEERRRLLYEYERGTLQVLTNCGVLTEGYDTPSTSCILMARPTKSRALFMQCVGRGLRNAPGKEECTVLDLTDNVLKHRLEPITLSKALGKELRNRESVREARAREKREQIEREQAEHNERTTIVTKRAQDLEIDVLARMNWERLAGGIFRLQVGTQKHQIFLFPSETRIGYYSVWAKLAPAFLTQHWLTESPLSLAMEHAEMKARFIQANEKKVILVDNTAPWRSHPPSLKQIAKMRQLGISFTKDTTSGEASDLIQEAIERRDRQRKAEKPTNPATKSVSNHSRTRKGRASA